MTVELELKLNAGREVIEAKASALAEMKTDLKSLQSVERIGEMRGEERVHEVERQGGGKR